MKYCTYCGNQLDNDAFCPKCGNRSNISPQNRNIYSRNNSGLILSNDSGLVIAVKIILVVKCILIAFSTFGFGLIRTIPMTISYFQNIKKGNPISKAFKVCTLLFVSLIAGILMFIDDEN